MNIFRRRAGAVRRDYSQKRYQNPLFQRQLQRGKGGWPRRLIIPILILAAVIGWCWFLFFSEIFQIREVVIAGQQRLQEWEVRDVVDDTLDRRRWLIFPMRSVFMLSEETLKQALDDKLVLESVDIQRRPPRTLIVNIKERVSSILVMMSDGAHAMLDLDGTVIRLYRPDETIPATDAKILLIDGQGPLSLRDAPVDAAVVNAVIAAPSALAHAFNGALTLVEVHLQQVASHTLRLVTSEGWGIYLDAKQPLDSQLANAELILRTKVGDDRKRLDYIDVRFQEKVFFKLK